jgi:hypothetical protein
LKWELSARKKHNPEYNLPLLGKMSRESHINQIEVVQQVMRDTINEYQRLKCPDPLPPTILDWATRPTPVLSPSPNHLPPLPFANIADWIRQHPGAAIALGIGIGVAGTIFIVGTGGSGALVLAGRTTLI